MTEPEKLALSLMIESVLEPDPKLRVCAHDEGCFEELMEWRQKMLDLLYSYEKNGISSQGT
jgi:hypothetical protein